jgi:hypothetical protein
VKKQQTIEKITPAELHISCKTLCFAAFIDAYCNVDLKGLIISGKPTPEELQKAWNEIVFEYSSLIKTEQSQYLFDLSKEISLLQWHINYVDGAIKLLSIRYEKEVAEELRELGYQVREDIGTQEYEDALKRIISLCKTKVFDLDVAVEEYNRLHNTKEGKAQGEDEMFSTLAALSKYQGYNIDKNTTSVYEVTIIFNNYLAESKRMEKQLSNG